jgi:hypothetical protein
LENRFLAGRSGVTSKDNIWAINTENEYHEEKAEKE